MQYYQEREDPAEDVPLKTLQEMALLPESPESPESGCSESPVEGPTAPTEQLRQAETRGPVDRYKLDTETQTAD